MMSKNSPRAASDSGKKIVGQVRHRKIDIYEIIGACFLCLQLVLLFLPLIAPVFAADPGDVIISEFSSASDIEWVELLNTTGDGVSLEGWKLTQLTNPQGETPTEVNLLLLSGTIPAGGILVFDVGTNKLNNPGDSIGLYDNAPALMHRVTYGTVTGVAAFTVERLFPGEFDNTKYSLTFDDPDGLSEFLVNKADGSFIWGGEPSNGAPPCPSSITSDTVTLDPSDFPLSGYVVDCNTSTRNSVQVSMPPLPDGGDPHSTKGWFNDAGEPGRAPILSTIDSLLSADGIESNIGELDNPSATPTNEDDGALYFEKEGEGKIVFTANLNLSDQATVAVLQDLGAAMEMLDGHIAFDSETADAMAVAGARIYMYGLNELGFTSTPIIIVKDDEGNVIDPSDENYPDLTDIDYDTETGTLAFDAGHFTQFDAEIDDNVYVDNSNESGEQDGTEGNPFLTIQEGINAVPIGGNVNVAFGGDYYYENLDIDKSLTLLGDPGNGDAGPGESTPTIIDNGYCEDRLISVEENNVTIKGFILDDDGCGRPVIRIDQEVSGAEISDNEIRQGRKGVDLSPYSNENIVTKNIIRDNDNEGVWIGGSTNNTISDNEIYGNARGVGFGEGGCDDECVGDISGNKITGNHIYENQDNDGGIHVSGDDVGFSELTISDNNITQNSGYGIYFDRVNEGILTISDNEITDNGLAGVYLSGNSGGIVDGAVLLENNTINSNSQEGVYVNRVDEESTLDVIGNEIRENGNDDGGEIGGDGEEGINYAGVYINNVFGESTVTFRDNTIAQNSGQGVYVCSEGQCSSSTLTFGDNDISDNGGSGLEVYDLRSSTLDILGNRMDSNGSGDSGAGFELGYVGVGEGGEGEDTPSTVTVSENTFSGNYYGIYINETDGDSGTTIGENNAIKRNNNAGIYLGDSVSGVAIIGNTIEDNGVESESTGIVINSATGNYARNNKIFFNGGNGVENNEGEEFDAERNWWGDVKGPFHETQNSDGTGDGVSDNVAFDPWYINIGRTILSTVAEIDGGTLTSTGSDNVGLSSGVSGQADLPNNVTNLVLNNDSNLDLSAGLADNAVMLQSGDEDVLIVLTNSDLDDVTVFIPDGTLITGPDGWDGIIQPPVSGTPSGNAPAGFSVGDTVINIGSPDGTLVFDNPVTILLEGVTGIVGYRPAGSDTWIEITNVCGGTYAEPEDPVSPGECHISNGTDTKIVTFHFTTFGSLNPVSSPAPAPAPSSGSGGGGGGTGYYQTSGGGGTSYSDISLSGTSLGVTASTDIVDYQTLNSQLDSLRQQLLAMLNQQPSQPPISEFATEKAAATISEGGDEEEIGHVAPAPIQPPLESNENVLPNQANEAQLATPNILASLLESVGLSRNILIIFALITGAAIAVILILKK